MFLHCMYVDPFSFSKRGLLSETNTYLRYQSRYILCMKYIPPTRATQGVQLPEWAKKKKKYSPPEGRSTGRDDSRKALRTYDDEEEEDRGQKNSGTGFFFFFVGGSSIACDPYIARPRRYILMYLRTSSVSRLRPRSVRRRLIICR